MIDAADLTQRVRDLVTAEALDSGTPPTTAGWLRSLCRAAARAIPADGVVITVMTDSGTHSVVASSDDRTRRLTETQFVLGEGPGMEAFAARRPVMLTDLTHPAGGAPGRWPAFSGAAVEGDVRAAFAFPLQVGAAHLGVMQVYREQAGRLEREAVTLALSFADLTMQALLDGHEDAVASGRGDDLGSAMDGRSSLYQAQGMVLAQLDTTVTGAMARMRAYAYVHGRALGDVADDIVARRLRMDTDRA